MNITSFTIVHVMVLLSLSLSPNIDLSTCMFYLYSYLFNITEHITIHLTSLLANAISFENFVEKLENINIDLCNRMIVIAYRLIILTHETLVTF